jgi:hypothetical protein
MYAFNTTIVEVSWNVFSKINFEMLNVTFGWLRYGVVFNKLAFLQTVNVGKQKKSPVLFVSLFLNGSTVQCGPSPP